MLEPDVQTGNSRLDMENRQDNKDCKDETQCSNEAENIGFVFGAFDSFSEKTNEQKNEECADGTQCNNQASNDGSDNSDASQDIEQETNGCEGGSSCRTMQVILQHLMMNKTFTQLRDSLQQTQSKQY